MEIVISIAAKIAECTVAPFGQWLSYSFHYNSNIENLKNQEEKLQHTQERVIYSVEAALRNGEEIYLDVSKWLTDVDRIIELATRKLREIEEAGTKSSNAACLNLKHRHQLSREAKKMMENITELLKFGNFDRVSYFPASKGKKKTRKMDYMAMESRMMVVKGIMEALGNAEIDKIGLWGMPGVGKSTLMKEIARQAKEEKLFTEVVMTNVTNNPDVRCIQGEIADLLDLQFDQETEKGRANHLQQRLSKGKNILVILDDIWKAFDLQEIGIPSKGCKVVMTSRDRDVLISGMGTQKAIHELKILRKEEAWNLFEEMAGDSVKDWPEVRGIATKIAEKCAGLPIALVTVSKALKNKSLVIWKDALMQLTRLTPEIWSPVDSCIQLSYEHLDGEEAVKSLFLFFAQQGYYISYQDLLRYGFGLGLFLNIYTLKAARNKLESLVSGDSCLLLESPHSSEKFYMHDLVRDVATIIASKNHNMFVMRDDGRQEAWPDVDALNRCEALSIHGGDIHKHPTKMECPKLRFFHVNCKDSRNLKIPDIFFQGMEKLEVLSLRNIQLSSLFPLTKLQTLCLHGCMLGDIHWIGELKTLVILSLAYSDISNLPREIGLLTRLQLLDLSNCSRLRVIPPNVLSSLVNLEELYMQKINVQWGVEGPNNEGINASLAELKELSHLITIEIDIPDANNLPKDFLNEKFERYKICIGNIRDPFLLGEAAFSRMLKLKLNMSFQLDFGIKMLLERIEYLYLDELNTTKSVLYELDREDFRQLKHFHIQNNVNKKLIPELKTQAVTFPILETFVLKDMINLEEIYQGNLPLESFRNLKVLKVENCEKLRFIFSLSIARGLSLLEELNIIRCNNMGAIFVKEEEDGIKDQGDMMLFGRLQTLVLKDLPKLMGFLSTKDSFMTDCTETNSEGNHDLQLSLLHHYDQLRFPSLRKLHLEGLPKIKHVWSKEPQRMLKFQALQDIYVGKCESLTSLFPAWVLGCLGQLKKIEIYDCRVEEIVAAEEGGVGARTLVFPRVTSLNLTNLQRLKWFYKGMHVSKWPMLKEMKIERCEEVEIFASGVMSFEETVEEIQSEMSIKQPLFLVNKRSFPSLETLHIRNMDKLEIIFEKLEGQNSKEPQVSIISRSEIEESEAATHFVSNVIFPNLKGSDMEGEYPETVFNFQNLREIHVVRCGSLKSLFPISVINCLEQLQVVEIKDCGVEEIVAVEGGGGEAVARMLEFPQVTNLNLISLKRLKWFYKGVHVTKWPMLKEMEIERCEEVEIFSSGLVSFEETVEERRSTEMSIKQPLFYVDEVAFPSLKRLFMINLPKIRQVWSEDPKTVFNFQNLQEIRAKRCESLKSFFPTSIVSCLEQLKTLWIEDCGVEAIVAGGGGEPVAQVLVFPRVTNLELTNLKRLKWFYKGVHVSKWPMLEKMCIEGCEKVEIFASGLKSFQETIEKRQPGMSIEQPLFLVDEQSFSSLKRLIIRYMDKLEIIWQCQDQVAEISFSNIQDMQVDYRA
ncbi:hypothetical protein I3842_08G135000 [Carya illinoinensis]|uniref:AAA+ ATPase domain-containing protein n=1 Tax=Carya illinoinensis TaxID=32201 RepID=A0A922JDX5_CARIL|nr:hypothetical protein I3842_08G135000 [Carya illinoinensis]KAG6700870.1 hypothetical protein I3842_08G135000 [Carya illinoinensis]KAG6700871.1 hypothetical protein I3842_08G135000 [Carya illinoinensis]